VSTSLTDHKASRRRVLGSAALAASAAVLPRLATPAPAAADNPPFLPSNPNTFTAPQTFQATTTGVTPLTISTTAIGASFAAEIDASQNGLFIQQGSTPNGPYDHSAAGVSNPHAIQSDTVDIWHRSTGDAIFILHAGGVPPSFQAVAGGDSALNVLIPLYLDATGDGRSAPTSNVKNNRSGMQGLFIQNQPPTNAGPSISIQNWAGGAGLLILNQYASGGLPTGIGRAIQIEEYNSSASSFLINGYSAPDAANGVALIDVRARWSNSGAAAASNAFQIIDSAGQARCYVDTAGNIAFNDSNQNRYAIRVTDNPVVALKDTSGNLRHAVYNDGSFYLYSASGATTVSMSSAQNAGNGALAFGIPPSRIGFFGVAPVPQPTLGPATASRSYTVNEQAMLQNAYNALRTLGLAS
jgi:hypothetical protein